MGYPRDLGIGNPATDPAGASVAALVARAKRGDAVAYGELYRRYVGNVYDFCFRKLGSQERAEDATSFVFLRALERLDDCREQEAFKGWLIAIARNHVTDIHRGGRREGGALPDEAGMSSSGGSAEEEALAAAAYDELCGAVDRCLGERDRTIVDLMLAGLNHKEIAAALGRAYGSVRNAAVKAVARLRDCLGVAVPKANGRRVET